MDFNATIDLIIRDLNEACEIIDDLKKYPGVPVLQVELVKTKCKSAGEVIALLKNNEVSAQPSEQKNILQARQQLQKTDEKQIAQTPDISYLNPGAEKTVPPGEDKKTDILILENIHSETPEEERSKHNLVKETDSYIVADRFSHLSNSFNEQLGIRNADEDLSERMKSKHLSSLTEAIGVNDKFLYIREIFNGNKDAYSQAISRLESIGSLTDARAVIMSYTGDNIENDAVIQLLNLVKRKLSSDE